MTRYVIENRMKATLTSRSIEKRALIGSPNHVRAVAFRLQREPARLPAKTA